MKHFSFLLIVILFNADCTNSEVNNYNETSLDIPFSYTKNGNKLKIKKISTAEIVSRIDIHNARFINDLVNLECASCHLIDILIIDVFDPMMFSNDSFVNYLSNLFRKFPSATKLYLYGNFSKVPNGLLKLKKLKRFECEATGLKLFPEELCSLGDLEVISISKCKLERIPNCIIDLENLKQLNLSRNNIRDIDSSIYKFITERIISFRIDGNPVITND